MSEADGQQEPSMEEILASIRRIISEEGEGDETAAKPAPRPAPAPPPPPLADEIVVAEDYEPQPPEPEEDPEDDVLELTDMVEEDDGTLVGLSNPRPPEDDIDAALGDEPLFPPEPRAAPAEPDDGDAIISDHAAAAAAGSLAVLTTAAGRRIADQLGASDIGGVTVEELVRQLLRPMLRDWLDEHLPPMVERMVRREIERLAAQGASRR